MENETQGPNTLLTWAGILIAIVLGVLGLMTGGQSPAPAPQPIAGAASLSSSINGGNVTNFDAVQTNAGFWILGVNVMSSTTASIGGIGIRGAHTTSLNQASTTICALQSPLATSTLLKSSLQLSVSSTTAILVTMAKSATPYATTTLLGSQVNVAANAQVTIVGSTTVAQDGAGANIFAPSTWLVISAQNGIGTYSPSGACNALFVETD